MKWKRAITAFKLGQGLIEADHAYLTAIGLIAKLNLKSGTYIWKHEDLYRDGDFTAFNLPKVEGEAVSFQEKVFSDQPAKTVKVQKQSGKIMFIG